MRPTKIAIRREHTGTAAGERIQRQAQDVARTLSRCPFLIGRLKSVRLDANVPLVIDHGLGSPAAFIVARHNYDPKRASAVDAEGHGLWVERAWQGDALATLETVVGDFTVGVRFVLSRTRLVSGVRFAWEEAGAATVRAKLWHGAVELARADVAVGESGVYVVEFAAPVLAPANMLLSVSIYETTGAAYVRSTGEPALMQSGDLQFGEVTKGAANVFSAGDAVPVSASSGETYWVEPVFRPVGGPRIEEAIDQTGIDMTRQLRVVADRDALVDLWLYPRASVTVDQSRGQSP